MIGLGMDTGGTCTDAVLYDMEQGVVLCSAKTQTTKENLALGIAKALEGLDRTLLRQAEFISLSTTLATNACIEGHGGKTKLLLIGLDAATVSTIYRSYGFSSMDDFLFLEGTPEGGFLQPIAPDWGQLEAMMGKFADCDVVAVVQCFPQWNQGDFEQEAKARISAHYDIPIVCGYQLFSDPNAMIRGAGAYLNGQLIPLIGDFFQAVEQVLQENQLHLPIYIVSSNGSLMTLEYAKSHPVETLLCGPAASALGGAWMVQEQEGLLIDIGGTTTDVSFLKEGVLSM